MGEKQLSSAEAELYDRQIRLWGIESQEKLRAANVLLIGIRGLGSEIAKNILLSGINSLTILDDGLITEDDLLHNFLLTESTAVGKKIAEEVLARAQALNPLVKIITDTESVTAKSPEFFHNFTIVVATKIKVDSIIKIDNICRERNVKFIYGDVFGLFGFSVADFQEHDYFEDRIQLTAGRKRGHDGEKKTVKVKGNISYPSLNKVLILPNTKQDTVFVKKLARPSNLFACLLTLLEFKKQHHRDPDYEKKNEDIEKLKIIAADIIELYNFTNLNMDSLYELLFGELIPVCAIVGGVMAQEVIKAVSHKEVTINNIFLFDPITYSGKELTVGA
ncbi:SUMO-activating enzyme subunit 1 [Asbolus verrucosus]|uniref:SUMO-activating enzyme subunit 1 n=1 Tax=Asbolus verrucosus TaxID=1661398 RepID=A0A482VGL2_ASBVE|nr:SUMO-activating enzyme subunit 1 [Asbolus verrucosus]